MLNLKKMYAADKRDPLSFLTPFICEMTLTNVMSKMLPQYLHYDALHVM